MKNKQRILSLIQPTGELHLGNYFGAIKNWTKLQNDTDLDCMFGVADYHAMTMPYNKDEFKNNVDSIILDLISTGIDIDKSTLFIQSLIPEHTELYWILNTVTSFDDLKRMTQFKDKSDMVKEQSVNNGLFSYPVLQASDIMIYKSHLVPVGADQLQHIELTRDIAKRFNTRYGDYFPVPEAKLTNIPKVMSLSNPMKKMSKSLGVNHYIGLFEDESSIRKKVKSAVTDTGEKLDGGEISPGVVNLFELLLAMDKFDEHEKFYYDYNNGNIRFSDLKGVISDSLVDKTKTFIERRKEVWGNKEKYIDQVIELSNNNRKIAQQTIKDVRKIVGLSYRK